MTAPERIWLQDGGDFDAASEVTWCQHSIDDADTEYVRADLAAVQPAQVRVKPLAWEDGTNNRKYAKSEIGQYSAREFSIDNVRLDLNGKLLAGSFNTIKAAKAAAQADYEARILAALEPQPDPRDEVIKGLVEALMWLDANATLKPQARKCVLSALAAAKEIIK